LGGDDQGPGMCGFCGTCGSTVEALDNATSIVGFPSAKSTDLRVSGRYGDRGLGNAKMELESVE
jgi:hypothetical protein